MLEFVVALPLLALIIFVTFFFGRSMMHQQQVKIADRYTAWRPVRGAGSPNEGDLESRFFQQQAEAVGIGHGTGPDDTLRDHVAEVGARHGEAQMLADHLILSQFPRGRWAQVAARFPTGGGIWDQMTGSIRHRHAREGVEWRHKQVDCEEEVRDDFLPALDQGLSGLPSGARGFGDVLRHLYNRKW